MKESHSTQAARREPLASDYDALYAAARDRLVRVCVGLVGPDAAEDVAHDAYLRGRSRFKQLRDRNLFEAWLTRIAVSICLNRRRRAHRLRELLVFVRPAPQPDVHQPGLHDLIERLAPRDQTIIVLHYGYGYQFEEIARMSGVPSGTVRSIALRARRRLAEQLKETDR